MAIDALGQRLQSFLPRHVDNRCSKSFHYHNISVVPALFRELVSRERWPGSESW